MSGFGVAPLAPSFDTIGFFGWTVDDAVFTYEAAVAHVHASVPNPGDIINSRIIIIDDPLIADCGVDMSKAFDEETERFRSLGYQVGHVTSPVSFASLSKLHWNTMIFEASRALAHLDQYPKDLIGSRLRETLEEGAAITNERYITDRAQINHLRQTFFEAFDRSDAYFWPATPEPAPKGLASTGEPKYIGPWTTLGGPLVTLKANQKSNDLPLGFILGGHPGMDLRTGALARNLS